MQYINVSMGQARCQTGLGIKYMQITDRRAL